VTAELDALVKLSLMDGSARELNAQLEEIPRTLQKLSASVQMLEMLLSRERTQITDAEALKVTQAAQLQASIESLSHARKKHAQATSSREADAGEREVEIHRRAIKEREEEIRRLGETVEAKKASLVEREKEFAEARAMLEKEQIAAQEKTTALQAERAKLLHGRENLLAQISPNVAKRYERLREKFGSSVVEISGGTCRGCKMSLPAQLVNELQRGQAVHECPHCRRIAIHSLRFAQVQGGESAAH
jgi:predicted  nucleic acid-binding Zn-ribbon protein